VKNVCASNRMGSWSSSTRAAQAIANESPLERYTTARAVVERLRGEIQARIDRACAAGFDLREMLHIPEIRQDLSCAGGAISELRSARRLLTA
jgi:hypothetical protein